MRWQCTRTGRVVYNRKKNPFTLKDVLRIIRSMDEHDVLEEDCDTIWYILEEGIRLWNWSGCSSTSTLSIEREAVEDFGGFGGGEFGGGGASRDFEDEESESTDSEEEESTWTEEEGDEELPGLDWWGPK